MKKLLTWMLLVAGLQTLAQQDALFSQYMFNMLVINPAYSGSRDVLSATLDDRYQWIGFPGAPQTLTFSAHTPLRNQRLAVGMYLYSDKLGPLRDDGLDLNYAYRILFGEFTRLAFGIDLGIHKMHIDWDKANPYSDNDIAFANRVEGKIKPDANFGIYFYSTNYYVGVSSKHLFENTMTVDDIQGSYTFTTLARHFYAMGGYAFPVNEWLVLKPSVLLKYTAHAPMNVDLTASALFTNLFWLGVSYRTERNAIVFLTEFNIGQHLRLGYSYDTYISKFAGQSQGSHEFMLNYEIDLYQLRLLRDLNVRYF